MIFEFDEYRHFLTAYLAGLPKKGYGEARKIAVVLSVSSTFISQIFKGERELNLEQADLLADYIGLSSLERDYFFSLIQKERAGTKKLKQYWSEKIKDLKNASLKISKRVNPSRVLSDEEKSIFYSSSVYSGIHLFTSTAKEGRALEEISQRFEISRAKGNEVMRFLCDTGLCVEENGRFQMRENHTHIEKGSPHLLKHHSNWRIKAIQYSEELSDEELMYTANISISKKDFQKLREEMVKFIKQFVNEVQNSPAEDIATFHMDFMWIKK